MEKSQKNIIWALFLIAHTVQKVPKHVWMWHCLWNSNKLLAILHLTKTSPDELKQINHVLDLHDLPNEKSLCYIHMFYKNNIWENSILMT